MVLFNPDLRFSILGLSFNLGIEKDDIGLKFSIRIEKAQTGDSNYIENFQSIFFAGFKIFIMIFFGLLTSLRKRKLMKNENMLIA